MKNTKLDLPLIGVVGSTTILNTPPFVGEVRSGVCVDNIEAVQKAGGRAIQIPITATAEDIEFYTDLCQGFLFPGGPDISPVFYGCDAKQNLGKIQSKLDEFQIALMKAALRKQRAILCICRGTQLFNIVLGGTLFQDLGEIPTGLAHFMNSDRADLAHQVIAEPGMLTELFGKTFWVNSFHHQTIKELGDGLRVQALAADGVIEAVSLDDYPFGWGVQWHPEMMLTRDDTMLPLFQKFICASREVN